VKADKLTYTEEAELAVIRQLAALPDTINEAEKAYDPSKITRYSYELAQLFHKFYDSCKIKGEEEPVMMSRLALCAAVRTVIRNLLDLLKVEAPEKM
jgi:arginyl-tRNA synthetase